MYGGGMNIGALAILSYAPIPMLFFGYWQLGNRQIFFNESSPIEQPGEIGDPGHKIFDFSKGIDHTILLILFIPLILFFRQFIKGLRYIGNKANFWKQMPGTDLDWGINLKVDENLGNYWNCIKGQLQMRWFAKEVYLNKILKTQTITSRSLEKMRIS